MLTGKYDEAETVDQESTGEQPDDEPETMLAAAERGRRCRPSCASRSSRPAKPDKSPATKLTAEGWRQFNQGQVALGRAQLSPALGQGPGKPAALNGLGFLLLNSGKTAEAKSTFEKYLEAEPDAAGPMNGLARCLKEEGKVDEAIALWEKMHKKYPRPERGHRRPGDDLLRSERSTTKRCRCSRSW